MKYRITIFAASVLLFACIGQVQAGGWLQNPEQGMVKFTTAVFSASDYILPNGFIFPISEYETLTTSLYFEYGWLESITLYAYIPFFKHISFLRRSKMGPADIHAGARIGLLQSDRVGVNVGVSMGIPVGNDDDKLNMALGNGEYPLYISMQAAHSIPFAGMYALLESGINLRMSWFPHEIRGMLELGVQPLEGLTLMLRYRGLRSLENGNTELLPVSAGYNGNEVGSDKLSAEALYELDERVGLSFAWEKMLDGKSTILGTSWSSGLYYLL